MDFNFNVEEWSAAGQNYETLAICRTLAFARAVFAVAIKEKPTGRFTIHARIPVVKRHPEGDWSEPLDDSGPYVAIHQRASFGAGRPVIS